MIPFHAQGTKTAIQVAFGAAGAGAEVAGTSTISPAYPTGIVGGMGLVAVIYVQDSAISATVTTPSGWTAIANSGAPGAAGSRLYGFFKQADGTESGNLTITGSWDTYGMARVYRTSDRVTGIESASGTRTAASATNLDCVNVTSTVPLSMGVQLFAANGASTTIGSATSESGVDYTEAVAEYVGASSYGILQIQTGAIASPGAVTGGSATLGAARTDRCRIGFVITP